jgi:DNA repair exonuclease SbcCD nuclease subunit
MEGLAVAIAVHHVSEGTLPPPPSSLISHKQPNTNQPMKLIHIADTHLGLAAFSRLDPESGMNLREKQVYDNFLRAINDIINAKPDVLVHAGDLFDTVKPKTKAYTTVLEALDRLHTAGIPLVIIAGNHSTARTRYMTRSIPTR